MGVLLPESDDSQEVFVDRHAAAVGVVELGSWLEF